MALGATRQDVVRSVVRAGGLLLGIGIVVGLAASRVTNRLVMSYVVMASSRPTIAVVAGRRRGHRAGRPGRLSDSGLARVTDEPDGRAAAGLTGGNGKSELFGQRQHLAGRN